jgi:hypothetical protein
MDTTEVDALLDLPDLERAEAMAALQERHNWDQETLGGHLGLSVDKTSRYLTPLKLSQHARSWLRSVPVERRPCLGALELVCRLKPPLQVEFLEAVPHNLSGKKQVKWLEGEFTTRGIVLSKPKYRRKYTLPDVPRFTHRLEAVYRKARGLVIGIKGMTLDGRRLALAVDEYPERNRSFRKSVESLVEELQNLGEILDLPESAKSSPERRELLRDRTVTHMDEQTLRLVLNKVSARQYVELAEKGLLKHQQLDEERPEHLPDPADVARELGIKK